MANITIGGDPSNYMDPPRLNVGGGGGGGAGGFIASLLDLIGVHQQVAKGPKEAPAPAQPESPTNTPPPVPAAGGNLSLSALNAAETAFPAPPATPMNWGEAFLRSARPLERIDPNSAF